MNNTLNNIIIFAAGAAIGSVVTWKLVSTKYDQLIQEEIDSVKEAYADKYEPDYLEEMFVEEVAKEFDEKPTNEEVQEYEAIAQQYGSEIEDRKEVKHPMDTPYIISPEEFAEGEYDNVSLWCFADGVITDEQYNIIEDVEELLGDENIESHFGDNLDDPDVVYVRNDYLETDYEICKDERAYSEID